MRTPSDAFWKTACVQCMRCKCSRLFDRRVRWIARRSCCFRIADEVSFICDVGLHLPSISLAFQAVSVSLHRRRCSCAEKLRVSELWTPGTVQTAADVDRSCIKWSPPQDDPADDRVLQGQAPRQRLVTTHSTASASCSRKHTLSLARRASIQRWRVSRVSRLACQTTRCISSEARLAWARW